MHPQTMTTSRSSSKPLAAQDVAWFRENWQHVTNADIAQHFHKSRAWVQYQAAALGLPAKNTGARSYGKTKWGTRKTLSPIDEEWLRENWDTLSLKDMAEHLHVAPGTLARLVEPLGLPRKRRPSKYRMRRVVASQKPATLSADPVYFAPLPSDIVEDLAQQGVACNTYAEALEELAQRDTWVRINTYRLQEPGAPRVFEWRIVKPDGALSGQGGDPFPSFHKAMNAALRRSVNILKEIKSKLS